VWQRVFNKMRILDYEGTNRERIRFVNQVLDSIKLPAITGTEFEKELLSENNFSCGQVFIFSKYMIHI
jgi:hypothetical protein